MATQVHAVTCLLVLALGCAREIEPPEEQPLVPVCAPFETRCDGDVVMACQDGAWVEEEDCSVWDPPEICTEDLFGESRCFIRGEELWGCVGAGQGSCTDGLTCVDSHWGFMCVIDCSDDPGKCGPDRYCSSGERPGGGRVTETPMCWWRSNRGGQCSEDAGCQSGLTCMAVHTETIFECKQLCPTAAIGTSPPECDGDTCFAFVETEQESFGTPRLCAEPGQPDICNASEGFGCEVIEDGWSTITACVREIGICGNEAPQAPAFANSDEVYDWFNGHPERLCEEAGLDQYCGSHPAPDGNAVVECTDAGFIGNFGTIPCAGPDDAEGCSGVGRCYQMTTGHECWIDRKLCVSFCSSPDGTVEYDCGSGYECVEQTFGLGPYFTQKDEGLYVVACDAAAGGPDNCDTDAGFACDCATWAPTCYCAKRRKICVPID